jgi:hypothetical protein
MASVEWGMEFTFSSVEGTGTSEKALHPIVSVLIL